jgi:hypothetical protein
VRAAGGLLDQACEASVKCSRRARPQGREIDVPSRWEARRRTRTWEYILTVAEYDRILTLPAVPRVSAAAQPYLCGDKGLVHLIYDLERLPNAMPVVHVIDPGSQPAPAALIEFRGVQAASLSRSGLQQYAAQEVPDSPWIRTLELRHRDHPGSSRAAFQRLRHFMVTFPEATLECAAEDIDVTVFPSGRVAAVAECHRRRASEPAA